MIVKVCGLRTADDAEAVNEAGPDMAGFVFYGPSRRCIDRELAIELRRILNPSIATVGVFVDEDPRVIAGLVEDRIISVVQLHGSEDGMYIHGLRAMTHAPIVKTFIARRPEDMEEANLSPADMVMLDAGKGSGKGFDWDLAQAMRRPFILSGGLTPENVGTAIARVSPAGVDVSSGVESGGAKDRAKVLSFVESARMG